jgi:cell division protein FtsI (penicillin-binding protein 3)
MANKIYIFSKQQQENTQEQFSKYLLQESRIRFFSYCFILIFVIMAIRLASITIVNWGESTSKLKRQSFANQNKRANIIDVNDVIIATDIKTFSLYADPYWVLDPQRSAKELAIIFPDLEAKTLLKKITRKNKRFVWIKRNLTPQERRKIDALGLPGFKYRVEIKRYYPQANLLAHLLGTTDRDNKGISGLELFYNDYLSNNSSSLQLTIDVRLQYILRDEIKRAIAEYGAKGGVGILLDAKTSAVKSLISLPDFDGNNRATINPDNQFNRATLGVYELGSVFKPYTVAMGINENLINTQTKVDARKPIKVSGHTIDDLYPTRKFLTVPEILIKSSNIATAYVAEMLGSDLQKQYLAKLGLLTKPDLDLPEIGTPLYPKVWRKSNTMTIGYGHGISVSPLQATVAMAAIVNGGFYNQPYIMFHNHNGQNSKQIFSENTSKTIRDILYRVVEEGSGRRSKIAEYKIGGKTGTAEKASLQGYDDSQLVSSYISAFPIDNPEYVLMVMLEEPQGNKSTQWKATAGLVATPTAQKIIKRIIPLVNITQ